MTSTAVCECPVPVGGQRRGKTRRDSRGVSIRWPAMSNILKCRLRMKGKTALRLLPGSGERAGPVAERQLYRGLQRGFSFTPSEFELTPYLREGENKLAAQVFKWTGRQLVRGSGLSSGSPASTGTFICMRFRRSMSEDLTVPYVAGRYLAARRS